MFLVVTPPFLISDGNDDVGVSRGYRILIPGIPFVVFMYLFYQLGAFLPLPEKKHFFWRVEFADGGMCVEDWSYGSYFNGGIEWIREYLRWMGNISRSSQV